MQVTFEVSEELARYLGKDPQVLSRAALEERPSSTELLAERRAPQGVEDALIDLPPPT